MNRRKRFSNPSEECSPRTRRNSRAGQSLKTATKRLPARACRRSTNREKTTSVDETEIIDCDNSVSSLDSSIYICSDDQPVTVPEDGDTPLRIGVLPPIEDQQCSTDILTKSHNTDVSTEPKKTARRGLAKKHLDSSSNVDQSISHNASVYSQCVAKNFKMSLQSLDLSKEAVKLESVPLSRTTETENRSTTKRKVKKKPARESSESSDVSEDSERSTANDCPETSLNVRSPTPPPSAKKTQKTKRINKKLSKALDALSQVKGVLNKTPKSKSRRKKISLESDVVLLYEEMMEDILVKVRYLSAVHKFRMNMTETFKSLITKVSQEIKEDEHNITLYLNDQKLKPSDSLRSVGLTVADIIECHCLKCDQDEMDSSDVINLVIRMSNKSKTTIQANKRRPLQDVINKFAEMKGLDHSSLVFSFDGEEMDPMETPFGLDMESDDCIDVS
ncbi:NFATC2-interacting protein [Biomphalaria glabrata]|nr:NFATC2-interacting protein-like [Biomphalaria glabrata]